jgi:serine/threonine protein kinase
MWLTIRSGPDEGKSAQVGSAEFVIGRDQACDLVVANDRRVSRRHAALRPGTNGQTVLVDLGSANGTFVNGRLLASPQPLAGGEQIRVGDTEMSVGIEQPVPDTAERVGSAPAADPRVGMTIGRYRIDDLIAVGGMGAVYLAEHLRLGKKVALKVLAARFAHDQRFRDRFVAESRMAAALDDPHVIPIYDADEVDGELFIAMKYVQGTDLATLIDDEGPQELRKTLSILEQVGHALDAAHARGLVHRDVKPGNVLVASGDGTDEAGHAYLCDFGITKQTGNGAGLTLPGQAVGTVNYMAPEQVLGEPIDGRTDIYALGCVLFECLTGAVPFRRDSQESVMWAHVNQEPPRVTDLRPDLPAALDVVVAKAMAKKRESRYATCAEMVAAGRVAAGPALDTAQARQLARQSTVAGWEAPAIPTVAEPAPRPTPAVAPPAPPAPPSPGLIGDRTVAERMPAVPAVPSPPTSAPRWRRPLLFGAPVVAAVVAVVLVLALSGGGTSVPTPPTRPLPPANPRAQPEAFSVTLTWRQPSGGGEALDWKVFRNNRLLDTVGSPTYVDRDVQPGQHYTYRIEALGRGRTVSRSTVVAATTPVPPVSEARVEGRYDVHYQVESSFGFSTIHQHFTQAYVFDPQCASGPCTLAWHDEQQPGLHRSVFTRAGDLYATHTKGDFSVSCDGAPVTSFLNYTLRVVQAGAQDGEWVATKLTGTMEEHEPAGKCKASGATYTLTVTPSS